MWVAHLRSNEPIIHVMDSGTGVVKSTDNDK